MSILEIKEYPDPVLLQPCEDVTAFDDTMWELVNDMAETMYGAAGVGLAAPQVGIAKRLITVDVSYVEDASGLIILANPVIVSAQGEEEGEEGCLSIPDFSASISRYSIVTVEGLDRDGKKKVITAQGLLARALQHEIDHTQGILILNRLKGVRGEMVRKRLRKQMKKSAL